ncbi:aromatic acid/H+ symport family MFS transporter [Amycolatopsis sp., V23-08]|uniref:Aromatic acid/H+ symport family MFS transporter n=1 Tax=Amycolatopsis heterodermiae TaxID=3110235 RepID=A0ABU5R4L0_9PSEU|nr:aromatic acid/H+ symport family MFS transporter [Amycolatopsis sp., V23-08]MEA5360764.1 aromatic acid/H+ symport family MFS transporter [Amycolatopsis sp., V23-08]
MSAPELSPAAETASSRLSVRVTALCWVLVLLDGLDLFVYGATLPGVLADRGFGLTAVTGGTIGSLTTFGMMLGALASGVVTDRIGRRKIILTGVVLFSFASAACALAPSVGFFGGARFVAGVGLGGLLPSAIAMVMEYAPPWRRNLAVTVVMTAHQAGGALAGALGMVIVESLGWRSVYWIGAVPIVVVLPVVAVLLPESLTFLLAKGKTERARAIADRFSVPLDAFAPEPDPGRRGGLRGLFAPSVRATTLLFWVASFAGLLLVYGVNTWLPTMMRANGYNLGSAISFLLVINVGGIAGMLVAGRLADRFGSRPVAITWFALTAAGVGLLALKMPLLVTYVVVFLTGGWLFSAQTLIYASVGAYYPADSRATALGWVSGVGRLGAVFGPWLGGILVAGGLSALGFGVFALAGLLGAVMVSLVRRLPKPVVLPRRTQHA